MKPAASLVAVVGAGMTSWGKWDGDFLDLAVTAADLALRDAGLAWSDVDFVSASAAVRSGYTGFVSAAAISRALGPRGTDIATNFGACASGAQAISTAVSRIRAGQADVVLVVGAEAGSAGSLAPVTSGNMFDTDRLRHEILGASNPVYLGLNAQRRIDLWGDAPEDFAQVRVKNSRHAQANPRARHRQPLTVQDVLASPTVSTPLHLLDICAVSDGAAALVLVRGDKFTGRFRRNVFVSAVGTPTPEFPSTSLEIGAFATDSTLCSDGEGTAFPEVIAARAFEEAGIGIDDIDVVELYDVSTAAELDWYEAIGLCGSGEAARLLRDGTTRLGGRIPVNPSGGLLSLGEAVAAQAIAQACELTWQLRGECGIRQVESPRAAMALSRGMLGNGAAIVLNA